MCMLTSPIKQYVTPKSWDIEKKPTILVIEDDEAVLKTNRAILERLGYNFLAAATGQEAIATAKTFNDDIDLAMLDMHLPDLDGNIIYSLLMQILPDLKVII
jgi:two-component system cell cycle sensor histidine kinase/response regulator CckA